VFNHSVDLTELKKATDTALQHLRWSAILLIAGVVLVTIAVFLNGPDIGPAKPSVSGGQSAGAHAATTPIPSQEEPRPTTKNIAPEEPKVAPPTADSSVKEVPESPKREPGVIEVVSLEKTDCEFALCHVVSYDNDKNPWAFKFDNRSVMCNSKYSRCLMAADGSENRECIKELQKILGVPADKRSGAKTPALSKLLQDRRESCIKNGVTIK